MKITLIKTFTLIELLVVIAIIAILAAILLPTLNSAQERAMASNCMNNLKQVGLSLQFYTDSNDEYIPQNNGTKKWSKCLDDADLASNKLLLVCPSTETTDVAHANAFDYSWTYGSYYLNSHYKINKLRDVWEPAIDRSLSETILFSDSYYTGSSTAYIGLNVWLTDSNSGSLKSNMYISLLHNNSANSLHGDGHVALASYQQIATDYKNSTNNFQYSTGTN